MIRIIAGMLFLTALGHAVAGDIYRCEGEDGTVEFSQQPCDDRGKTVKLEGDSRLMSEDAIWNAQKSDLISKQFLDERVSELVADGTDLSGNVVMEEEIEVCKSEWTDSNARRSWQCMAAARTPNDRQQCVADDFNRLFSFPEPG